MQHWFQNGVLSEISIKHETTYNTPGLVCDYRTFWHRTIWHSGQFNTGQFDTADYLTLENLTPGQFDTMCKNKQFDTAGNLILRNFLFMSGHVPQPCARRSRRDGGSFPERTEGWRHGHSTSQKGHDSGRERPNKWLGLCIYFVTVVHGHQQAASSSRELYLCLMGQ